MLGGLIVLVAVLAVASAAGLALRARQGRFTPVQATSLSRTEADDPGPRPSSLSPADLGAALGARATLVQFSTEVCAYCPATRNLLTEVAGGRDGVAFVEIDAADRMDLTRQLHVLSTPTVLVLDADGGIASRSSGPVRRADLLAAVGSVLQLGDDKAPVGE